MCVYTMYIDVCVYIEIFASVSAELEYKRVYQQIHEYVPYFKTQGKGHCNEWKETNTFRDD